MSGNLRTAVVAAVGWWAWIGSPIPCRTADEQPVAVRKATHVYKSVGKLQIKLDVHRPDDQQLRPVVVWIHGGALIGGHRENVDRRLKSDLLKAGCALISIDYRLAPETKLPALAEDIDDAFAWIRANGAQRLNVDATRLAVAGGSAGGYLTLLVGNRIRPRPAALVSLYGYGDLVGPWYSQPSPHRRHNRVKVDRAFAVRQVAGPPIADARDRKGDGGAFYNYCRQTGSWPFEVSGWDPVVDRAKFAAYMPAHNVAADFPPTLLIHGDKDTDVPVEQSQLMAAALKHRGVDHRLLIVPNAEHGLAGAAPADFDAAYAAAARFLLDRLEKRAP